ASSVAFRLTVCGPAAPNVAWTVGPVASVNVPSPSRSQASFEIVPSGSLELEVKVIAWPVRGAAGAKLNAAVGARSSGGAGGAGGGGGASVTRIGGELGEDGPWGSV